MDDVERMLPLYEGKMIHHFDHRWNTFEPDGATREVTLEEKQDSDYSPMPRYWVRESVVMDVLDQVENQTRNLVAFRDICRATDMRTVIATNLPIVAVGHTMPLVLSQATPKHNACLSALLCSFILDFVARQKMGGTHLTYNYFQQLSTIAPKTFETSTLWNSQMILSDWISQNVVELIYIDNDLTDFAISLGFNSAPFRWDPARRAVLRAELDAAFFHLYGITREDVDYIMETFPIVKRHDEGEHGEYRTKRMILEVYDAMAAAMRTGVAFQSALVPGPGQGERA